MQGHPTNAKQTNKNHKANAKQKNTQPKQHTTRHKAKTARPVISWSVHSHLKRIRRDDNLASPWDWYGKIKQERTTNNVNAIQQSVSQEATRAQCGNRGSPSQEPRDHRLRAARATFTQVTSTQSKSQQ